MTILSLCNIYAKGVKQWRRSVERFLVVLMNKNLTHVLLALGKYRQELGLECEKSGHAI